MNFAKIIAGALAPIILEAVESGIPDDVVYAKTFDEFTEIGKRTSDLLNEKLGEFGETVESVAQKYVTAAVNGAIAGWNNGCDINELPNPAEPD